MAHDIAKTAEGPVSRRQRKNIEMLFAPSNAFSVSTASDWATAQNLRKLEVIPMPGAQAGLRG
jgi:hypothetical protein